MLWFLREELVAFLTKTVHVKILLLAPGCLVSQSRTRPPVSACDSHTDLSSYFPSGCYRLSFHPNNGFQILKNIQIAAYRKEETAPSHKQENYDYLRKHFLAIYEQKVHLRAGSHVGHPSVSIIQSAKTSLDKNEDSEL